MAKNNSSKKYTFFIRGINTEKIEQRYGITIVSNISESSENIPFNTTKLSDISSAKNNIEVISFLDESKKTQKCIVSMIDFLGNISFEDSFNKRYDCFWCRNSLPKNVTPIGCPIRFVPSQIIKKYYSEISKDEYTIREKVTNKRFDIAKTTKTHGNEVSSSLNMVEKNYYQTDGIFCSFNCCMAYIINNKSNSMYNMSEMLLLKMYNDIYPDTVPVIEPAPHWRKLKQCGGDLSIEAFRDSFNKIEYKNHGIAQSLPKFRSSGVLFEEKLKF